VALRSSVEVRSLSHDALDAFETSHKNDSRISVYAVESSPSDSRFSLLATTCIGDQNSSKLRWRVVSGAGRVCLTAHYLCPEDAVAHFIV